METSKLDGIELAKLERRMRYNSETTTRFSCCKTELKQAVHFEKRSEPKEAIYFLERMIHEAKKLQLHLRAWDEYKQDTPQMR